jgi:hypothetical protein
MERSSSSNDTMPATLTLDEADEAVSGSTPKTLSLDDADKLIGSPEPSAADSLKLKPPPGFASFEDYDKASKDYDEGQKSSDFLRAVVDPQTGVVPEIGKGLSREGKMITGTLADIGTLPIKTGENKFRNLEAATMDRPMPVESEMKKMSVVARAAYAGTAGTIQSTPQMAAFAADPLLGAMAFGTTPNGFDPKLAVVAGVLPVIGKYSGAITEAIAAKAGVTSDVAKAALNKVGGASGAAATIGAQQVTQIFSLPKDQQRDAWIDAVGNVGSMFLLGTMGERHQLGKGAKPVAPPSDEPPSTAAPVPAQPTIVATAVDKAGYEYEKNSNGVWSNKQTGEPVLVKDSEGVRGTDSWHYKDFIDTLERNSKPTPTASPVPTETKVGGVLSDKEAIFQANQSRNEVLDAADKFMDIDNNEDIPASKKSTEKFLVSAKAIESDLQKIYSPPGVQVEARRTSGGSIYITAKFPNGESHQISIRDHSNRAFASEEDSHTIYVKNATPETEHELQEMDASIEEAQDWIVAKNNELKSKQSPSPVKLETKGKAKSEADRKANEEFQSKNQSELFQPKPPETHTPLGASTPEDLRSSSSTPTGIKITAIDAQRAARGEEPLSSVGRRSFKTEVWQAALAKVDNDPQAPAKLVNTMMSDQVAGEVKPLSDGDVAMLLYREAELTYERSRLAREMAVAADDARQFPNRAEALQRLTEQKNRVDEDLNTLEKVIAPAKSETARGLAALRNMVGDSYNLESMRYDFQKKTSHPLTEADEAFIKTEFERIDAAEKQRLKDEAEYRAAEADAEANRAREDLIDSVGREPKEKVEPVEPHVRLVAEKLKNYFKTNADAALERIRARHNGTTSMFSGVPLHPEDFDDAVIFGASKMFEKGISGAEMSADWATEMASTFGDGIKSLLQTIWAKANQSLDAGFKKIAGVGPAAEKAKRATRPKVGARDHVSEKKAIVEGIREAVADGEGDVNIGRYANAIAKNFVRQEVESGRVPKDIKGEEIDAAVHEVLKDFIPEISPVESRDAWTQYGKFKPATQDPIKIRMAEARSEQQKLSTIERLQKGLPGLMTGFGRAKATDLLRRRIAQINELKRQLGIVTTDPATQLRSALEAKLTRQKNRIADLKFENSTRKRIVREKTPSPDNEETLRNKAEIAELEKQNREIFGNRTLSDAQKLKMATAAAEKSAKDWEQKLVDAKQGKFAKPQAKKPLTSKELEAIKARRDAAKAEFKELQSLNEDFQREQRAKEIEHEKDALEKSIAEKEKQIKSGDIAVKKQPVKPSTPELDALKKRRDDLNDQIRELRKPQKSPEEIAVNRRLTQLANRTADYLDRAARQDFKPKPKRVSSIKTQAALQKVATATSKADAAKKEWSNAAEKYRIAHRTTAEKVVEGLADTYHLTRAVAVLYHGTVGMITHAGGLIFRPNASVIWWRNFIRQFPMWLSPKYHEVIIYKLKTDPDFQTWKDAGASIDPNEVYTDYGLYGKMFGKFTGGSRGFDSLKLTRMELNKADWKKVPSEIKNDPEQASLTRKRIAEINNRATGAVGSSRDIFSEVAKTKIAEESGFAPRLYASRWGRVVLDPIKTAKTALNWKTASAADKYAAKVRLRNAGYFIGGYISALAINQGLLIATGSKERVNMADPTKSDWLKFKVGGKVITADGGLLDPVRLLGQIVIGDLMMPRTKKDVFLHGNRFQKAGMDILKYGRGKINPSLGLVVDVGTGSDYSGRPLPFSNEKPQFKDQTQYSVTEYLLSKGPIPLSIASKEVYDEMVKNGMSSVHAMDIVKGSGLLVFTMTGAHLTEDYKFDKETAAVPAAKSTPAKFPTPPKFPTWKAPKR